MSKNRQPHGAGANEPVPFQFLSVDNFFFFCAIIISAEIVQNKMLYKPPKAKRYITIGVIAILLAVLAIVAIPIIYKNKPIQTPPANISKISQQQKIQKESQRLDEIKKSSGVKDYSQEEINQQSKKLDELRNQAVK